MSAKPVSSRRRAALPGEVRIIGGQWRRTRLPVADRQACGRHPTACARRCSTGSARIWAAGAVSTLRRHRRARAGSRLARPAEVLLVEQDAGLAAGLRALKHRLRRAACRCSVATASRRCARWRRAASTWCCSIRPSRRRAGRAGAGGGGAGGAGGGWSTWKRRRRSMPTNWRARAGAAPPAQGRRGAGAAAAPQCLKQAPAGASA